MTDAPVGGAVGTETSPVKQALAALRGLQGQLDETRRRQTEPIAIVGMACRYPGADSPEALWQLLLRGEDAITDTPADRWDIEALYDANGAKPGKLPSRRGGFLSGLEQMDAAFFGISPREAPHVDPRQRVMLEMAWEALEDAGIPPDSLAGSSTGVFVATLTNDYDHLLFNDLRRAEVYSGAGTANSVVANRLSYFLDLHGPSMALDTACSGSLVAVHLACESLRSGESSLVLAGGVSVNLMAKSNVFFARSGALSPSGLCRTFDAKADGIVRSDGAGIVVLKRLSDALRDEDTVLAVIRGSAVNHDGRSNGIMAPNGAAQRAVLADAYRRAGVDASAVQYVELHGTGTPLGDPVEAQALLDVLGAERKDDEACLVGSMKSNVGHTEAAAGVGGLIKTVLAMRKQCIPASAHFESLNPLIPFEGTAFRVAGSASAWPSPQMPLVAGVSGFGFGGTNAHVVLEEAPALVLQDAVDEDAGTYMLPLSAATPEALAELVSRFEEHLASSADKAGAICRTAALRRTHHACRAAVVGSSREELARGLRSLSVPSRADGNSQKMAFVFSGQGSHWPGMGKELYALEPVFRDVVDQCEEVLQERWGWSPGEQARAEGALGSDTAIVQPAIFIVQAALGELWRAWGIVPDFVVGHSLGEAAAAYFAGVLRLEDALGIVVLRSRLMKRVAGMGKTAVAKLTVEQAEREIAGLAPDLVVAGSNSPSASVLSGSPEAVDRLIARLGTRGVFCKEVAGVDIAFHSPQMDPLQQELTELLAGIRPEAASIPVVSTVTAGLLAGEEFDAAYWGRNLREPFLFTQATECLLREGCGTFVEVSPHALLSSSLLQTARSCGMAQTAALASMRKDGANELRGMYETLAQLFAQGREVEWKGVYPQAGRCVSLPHYPWQRQRYWFDQLDAETGREAAAEIVEGHPLLGIRIDAAFATSDGERTTLWQAAISEQRPDYLADHRVQDDVVVPGSAWLEMAREAGTQVFGARVALREVSFDAALRVTTEPHEVQTVLTGGGDEASIEIFSRRPQGAWMRHVHGKVVRLVEEGAKEVAELETVRARCLRDVPSASHYAAMGEKGLEYGPGFRLLTKIVAGESEAVAQIEVPAGLTDERYGMHPAMLDAALQLAAVAQNESGYRYLPAGVTSCAFFAPSAGPLWCHVVLRGTPGDAILVADLVLTDEAGKSIARVDGLRLQRLAERPNRGVGLRAALVRETWMALPLLPQEQPKRGSWLIFAGTEELADQLAFRLAEFGQNAMLVRQGARYRQVNESSFEIGADLHADVARLLREERWTRVVLLSGVGADGGPADAGGCALGLAVAQGMLQAESGAALSLVTWGSQAVRGSLVAPAQAPLAGFALAIAYERPELQCSLIDLDPGEEPSEAEELAAELLNGGNEVRVAWRRGERFVSRLEGASMPSGSGSSLDPKATYLITGGLGSLGLKTAERMVRDGARHLVLTSRSAADSAAVEALRSGGATVTVVACDLSRVAEVERLFTETLASMPPLRGVIHSAGVVEDALLPMQTLEGFRRVMSAKVAGAWNLHRQTQALALDFFVMYSSAASLIGAAGQANYASANAFLDGLAHYRRSLGLAAVSLNWGAWSGDGMASRTEVQERLATLGVGLVPAAEGLDLLSIVLAGGDVPAQLGVFPADWERFVRHLPAQLRLRLSGIVPLAEVPATENIAAQLKRTSAAERTELLRGYLPRMLAMVLGYKSAGELNLRQRFFELGMDSLTAIEFRNRLQEDLGMVLPSSLAFDYPDVGSLADYLASALYAGDAPALQTPVDAAGERAAMAEREALGRLSSDELAQLLVQELAKGGTDVC